MKLIFCPHCHDIVKLNITSSRCCLCGKSCGKYDKDGIHAWINKEAIPLIFVNSSFFEAMRNRPKKGMGKGFVAAVVPEQVTHIAVVDDPSKMEKWDITEEEQAEIDVMKAKDYQEMAKCLELPMIVDNISEEESC